MLDELALNGLQSVMEDHVGGPAMSSHVGPPKEEPLATNIMNASKSRLH